MNKRTCL